MIKCPQCNQEVIIKIRTDVGVCFKCPKHGVCGLRYDSMTPEDATCLQVIDYSIGSQL